MVIGEGCESRDGARSNKCDGEGIHPMAAPAGVKVGAHEGQRRSRRSTSAGIDAESQLVHSVRDRLPEVGEIVLARKHSFTLNEIIGVGGYGCVFKVTTGESQRPMALKAELYSKAVIKNEIVVLKCANTMHCSHMCELFDYGRVGKQFMYIVQTLLGQDLYRLRRDRASQCFTLGTTLRAAYQTLKAIEELHECGFLSRDIKPSNFAIGSPEERRTQHIFIFDFGLAKRFIKNGVQLKNRGRVGWRGTARYGSLMAHAKQDLGRKDDLESWFYTIVEFANGSLPWRFVHDRVEVGTMKEASRHILREQMLAYCPPQFDNFISLIDELTFESKPPYDYFYGVFQQVLNECKITMDALYDWEISEEVLSPSASNDETSEQTTQAEAAADPEAPKLSKAKTQQTK